MSDDLTSSETAAMWTLTARPWTSTTRIPTDTLNTLVARGLVEVSTWAEWARLTDAGTQLFEVVA